MQGRTDASQWLLTLRRSHSLLYWSRDDEVATAALVTMRRWVPRRAQQPRLTRGNAARVVKMAADVIIVATKVR